MSRVRRLGLLLLVVGGCVVGTAAPAAAHPLGNATVNHYDGLRVFPDHVGDLAVEDVAEIPTLQRKPTIDSDGDGVVSAGEANRYAGRRCASLAAALRSFADGAPLRFAVARSTYTERPGAIRLPAGRLTCQLGATVRLAGGGRLEFADDWDSAGIGWHEITAVGAGVALRNSPFPATSISDALARYPNDLLSAPLDVRRGTLDVAAGAGASTYRPTRALPVAGTPARLLNRLTSAVNDLVGARHLTFGVGLLALILAGGLGAGHALLPGHGKTIMAAYLVGRRGRRRDVLVVGGTVTATHTVGVLVLGLLISLTSAFAPTAAEVWLGVASGLIVASVGVGLLLSALRRYRVGRRPHAWPGHSRHHGHEADHQHVPADGHHHGPSTGHVHSGRLVHPDHRSDQHPAHGFGRSGLLGLGVAGGLVPSPSALLVLLAAIALGRTAFGVAVVLAYGLGMAASLTLAGLLLIRLRGRLERGLSGSRLPAAVAALPVATGLLVVLVGTGLTLRALSGAV